MIGNATVAKEMTGCDTDSQVQDIHTTRPATFDQVRVPKNISTIDGANQTSSTIWFRMCWRNLDVVQDYK